MGRYHSVPQSSNRVRYEMILSLVSSVLFASLALGAPGASNYGAAAVVGPAKQIASSPSIQCRTEYVTLWDTEYQEKEEQVCVTKYEKECTQRVQRLCQPTTRQECHTEYEKQCNTIYKNVCVQKFRTEYEPYTESECTTEYKQDCQYEWKGSRQRQGVGSHRGNLPERSLRRVQGRGEDPRQAGRLPGVQRRPRAEVRVRAQADLRHRPRPDLQDRASDRVPGRTSPAVPLRAQEVPSEDQQAGTQEGLRRGAQHRSSCSCCRPPSPCPSPSFSLSAGSPQLRRPRRPHTDCAPDH